MHDRRETAGGAWLLGLKPSETNPKKMVGSLRLGPHIPLQKNLSLSIHSHLPNHFGSIQKKWSALSISRVCPLSEDLSTGSLLPPIRFEINPGKKVGSLVLEPMSP